MRVVHVISFTVGLALLAGCSGTENDIANSLTDQNKYEFYSCPQIAQNIESTTKKMQELERLMATASKSAGGDTLSTITYRPEYLKQRGNLNVLLRTAREKSCSLSAAR